MEIKCVNSVVINVILVRTLWINALNVLIAEEKGIIVYAQKDILIQEFLVAQVFFLV